MLVCNVGVYMANGINVGIPCECGLEAPRSRYRNSETDMDVLGPTTHKLFQVPGDLGGNAASCGGIVYSNLQPYSSMLSRSADPFRHFDFYHQFTCIAAGNKAMVTPGTPQETVALIGLGAIGISFAALHLRFTNGTVRVFDTRPDLEQHLSSVLPGYINSEDPSLDVDRLRESGRLKLCSSLEEACEGATLVQEQGPENLGFKRSIWAKVEKVVSNDTQMWTSTSGIAASLQTQDMVDKTRLLVVHPFNPPHIMPLIEIVPSNETRPERVDFAKAYFESIDSGHRPVVIHKELPGFVGNRLAFAILREACSLVDQDVVSSRDVDVIMQSSLGPRWAVQGLFESYNMGGGAAGIEGFLGNLSGTIQNVWDSASPLKFEKVPMRKDELSQQGLSEQWEAKVISQTSEAYGTPNPAQFAVRDNGLREVLRIQEMDRKS